MNHGLTNFFCGPARRDRYASAKYARTKRATLPRLPGVALCVDTPTLRTFIHIHRRRRGHSTPRAHSGTRACASPDACSGRSARESEMGTLEAPKRSLYTGAPPCVEGAPREEREDEPSAGGLPQAYERGYRFLIRYA